MRGLLQHSRAESLAEGGSLCKLLFLRFLAYSILISNLDRTYALELIFS